MLEVQATARGLANLEKLLKVESARHKKALETAMKVRGFKLRNELKNRIKQGYSRTGTKTEPLTFISMGMHNKRFGYRRTRTKYGIAADAPLVRLGPAVTYDVKPTGNVNIGWTDRSPLWARHRALEHAEGFTRRIGKRLRERIIRRGAELGKIEGGNTPFFLKRSTKSFKTPPRPIMRPFWFEMRQEAMDKIRRDFRAKLAGKRV